MPRPKNKKHSVRLSVTLDEDGYAKLSELGAKLDLSAAWMIRRSVSEFVARHAGKNENELPLRHVKLEVRQRKRTGGCAWGVIRRQ